MVQAIFGINHPRDFWKLKLPLFYWVNFKIFKNALGKFIPNRPPLHAITTTHKINCRSLHNENRRLTSIIFISYLSYCHRCNGYNDSLRKAGEVSGLILNITTKECFNWTVSQIINILPFLCSSPINGLLKTLYI